MTAEQNSQQNLESLHKEIRALTAKLQALNEKKEDTYREKEEVDKQLNIYIKSAQEIREKKKEVDKAIREQKTLRDSFNNVLKDLWNKYNTEKAQITPKKDTRVRRTPPALLKRKIEQLEHSIETEIVDFDKEQRVMTQIKLLKSQLNELADEDAKYKELKQVRELITTKKSEADEHHKRIQILAKNSTDLFDNLTKHSEDIAEAKRTRKKLQAKIKKFKVDIETYDRELNVLLEDWSKLSKEAPPVEQATAPPTDMMDKLRGKKRLTKDDLLAMQRSLKKQ